MNISNKENITKGIAIRNILWKFGERMGSQIISFVLSIILARILLPQDYGLIAMVLVFINIASVFVVSGIGQSLVQKNDADELDFSSIFYMNLIVSTVIYLIIFFTAPSVSKFYGYELLTPMMRVLGVLVFFYAINSIQGAYIAKKMLFKRSFYATLGGTLISFVLGILLALKGFGAWALVGQQLSSALINTIVLWYTLSWRPKKQFSFKRVQQLFSFGWKIQLAGLLTVFSNEIRNLIIGKLYSSEDLAFYTRGSIFPRLFGDNLVYSLSAVIFPIAATYQKDKYLLKELARKYVRITSYFFFPIMAGLAATASSLISVILTDKWLPAVPYLRIAAFSYAVIVVQVAVQDSMNALGRSDIYLYMDFFRKVIGLTLVFVFMRYGVLAIALTVFISGPASVLMTIFVSRKILGYSLREHLQDNLPILTASLVMGALVFLIEFLDLSSIITLILQVAVGIVLYVLFSYLFKPEGFDLTLDYLNKFKNKVYANRP